MTSFIEPHFSFFTKSGFLSS